MRASIKISAVSFDWDNTLARPLKSYETSYLANTAHRMAELGYRSFGDELPDRDGQSYREYFAALWDDDAATLALSLRDDVYRDIPYQANLIEGARDSITMLLDRGIPVVIVSSLPQGKLESSVKVLLGDLLSPDLIFGMDEHGVSKPNPEVFLRAAGAVGLRPDTSIWHVGDHSRFDVYGAVKAGLSAVHFGRDSAVPFRFFSDLDEDERAVLAKTPCAKDHAALRAFFESGLSG